MYKIFEETQLIGKQVIFLPKCRSTNDIAADMLRRGVLVDGSIVITDHQYAGKGQRGNSWYSVASKNLTFSVAVKAGFISPMDNFFLNIIASLSLVDVLNDIDNQNFRIKWPNDIMFDNQKIAGILIENSIQSGKIENAIIGIGLNINQVEFDLTLNATSMKLIFNKTFDINDILNRFVQQFEKTYLSLKLKNHEELKIKYLSNLYWLNEEHTFKSSIIFRGIITGIDEIGRLEVNINGVINKFNFKEIEHIE